MAAALPRAVGGLFEVCIGVTDFEAALGYWSAFGFRAGPRGALAAKDARRAFGVDSALQSIRLYHGAADHGLIRLLKWDAAHDDGAGSAPTNNGAGLARTNNGAGLAPYRGHGSRWQGQFVRNAADIAHHAAVAKAKGQPVYDLPPAFIDMTAYNPALFGGKPFRPFADKLTAVSEYTLIQPHARQAFLQRFNYDSRMMGRFVDDCLFPATHIVHGGMMFTSDDAKAVDFYDTVLGLKRVSAIEMPYAKTTIQRAAFDLAPDDTYWAYIFEEPRSGPDNDTRRSGRLLMFRFGAASRLPDRRAQFSPGALGPSLFTWRVRDVAETRAACQRADCRDIGEIGNDEFGTACFSCTTPDGFVWMFIQTTADEAAALSV